MAVDKRPEHIPLPKIAGRVSNSCEQDELAQFRGPHLLEDDIIQGL